MARQARRSFTLFEAGPTGWEMDWPPVSRSAELQLNLYDYYQHYVLVCPGCGNLWCKSTCSHPPDGLTSVRTRWCAACMPTYIGHQLKSFEGLMINSMHCPGTVLSFDDRLLSEGADQETWEACFFALPVHVQQRELELWCQFDLLCNPEVKQ